MPVISAGRAAPFQKGDLVSSQHNTAPASSTMPAMRKASAVYFSHVKYFSISVLVSIIKMIILLWL
jgi:hypothetical protein